LKDIETTAYHIGRRIGDLKEPYCDKDKVFGSSRLDKKEISDSNFKHCTFANISFKQVKLQNGQFLNCVFIGCYFRRAELINTKFTGCKFIDCNFSHLAIKSCDFRYSSFHGCQIEFSEMVHSLPSEPNLKEEITRNLALESMALGLSSESRKYRMNEIRAKEEHLLSATLGSSQWYRDHYNFLGRIQTFIQFLLSLLNRWLWGYGERSMVLIRNIFLITFAIFPILFYLVRHELEYNLQKDFSFWHIVLFSVQNVLPTGIVSGVVAIGSIAKFLAGIESFFGIVAIALFASYIFRWSLHR